MMSEMEIIMYNEFKVLTPKGKFSVYAENGFYNTGNMYTPLHKHTKAEVHIVDGDFMHYLIDNTEIRVPANSLVYIPAGTLHNCIKHGDGARVCAFQTDYQLEKFQIYSVYPDVLNPFFEELSKIKNTQNYSVVSSYIALMFSMIDANNTLCAKPIENYYFLIDTFFEHHYAEDVSLGDLAKILHLSERQTQRVLIKHTGNSFKQELCKKRLEMAKILKDNTNMTLTEIALKVGYKSYVGFWKALNKQSK